MAVSPNNSLDILIRTKAELKGAEDTAKALEQQIGKAKALGKEYGALEAKLNGVRASIANAKGRQDELTDSFADAAKKSEFLGLKHSALHKIVHQLSEAFPEVGAAARLMMNPVVFALTAAITVFVKAKEKLSELNAEMDKAAEAAAKPVMSFDQVREALNATVDDIYKMRTEYAHWTKVMSEQSNQIVQDLTAETEAFREQVEAAQKLLEAKKNLALQRVEEDQNTSPEEKERRRFVIEKTADATGRQMSVDAGRVEVEKTAKAFDEASLAQLAQGPKEYAANQELEAARAGLKDKELQAKIAAFDTEQKSAEEQRTKAMARLEEAQKHLDYARSAGGRTQPAVLAGAQSEYSAAQREFDAADTRFATARRDKGGADDELARRQARLKAAETALADLKTISEKLHTQFEQLSISLDKLQRHQETLEKSTAAVAGVETQRKVSEFINKNLNSPAGHALVGAEEIAERSRTGRQITDQEKQSLIQIASQIAGRQLTFEASRDYFGRITHRPGESEPAKALEDKYFANALEKLTEVLQKIADRDRTQAADQAAHPGTPIKPDEYARFRAGFKTATDELGDVMRKIWLDATTEIRALTRKMEMDAMKKPQGTD